MFKTDKKSLEKLSFEFNALEIANLRKLIEIVSERNLNSASLKELKRLTKGLDEIGRLKLDGMYYGFSVDNNTVKAEDSEGIRVYLRQGDRLESFIDWLPYPQEKEREYGEVVELLKKNRVYTLYTGRINNTFLGLDYMDAEVSPIIHEPLDEMYISQFKDDGIEVIVLDSLI